MALASYQRAFSQKKTAYLLLQLLKAYKAQGNLDAAIKLLESYLEENPDDYFAMSNLAVLYQQVGENILATVQYEKLAASPNNSVSILNNLAWLYWLQGDSRSLKTAEAAYNAAPENPHVADTYGWIMLHKGDQEKALEIIQQAAVKVSGDPTIRFHLAQAFYANGDLQQAAGEIDRVLNKHQQFQQRDAALALKKQIMEKLSSLRH